MAWGWLASAATGLAEAPAWACGLAAGILAPADLGSIALFIGLPLKASGFLLTAATAAGPLVRMSLNAACGGRGGAPTMGLTVTTEGLLRHPLGACGLGRFAGKLQGLTPAETENEAWSWDRQPPPPLRQ